MCLNCWDEEGRPFKVTEAVKRWAPRFGETNPYGAMHIVVDDWNLGKDLMDQVERFLNTASEYVMPVPVEATAKQMLARCGLYVVFMMTTAVLYAGAERLGFGVIAGWITGACWGMLVMNGTWLRRHRSIHEQRKP
jgi:hypothetical protein